MQLSRVGGSALGVVQEPRNSACHTREEVYTVRLVTSSFADAPLRIFATKE